MVEVVFESSKSAWGDNPRIPVIETVRGISHRITDKWVILTSQNSTTRIPSWRVIKITETQ